MSLLDPGRGFCLECTATWHARLCPHMQLFVAAAAVVKVSAVRDEAGSINTIPSSPSPTLLHLLVLLLLLAAAAAAAILTVHCRSECGVLPQLVLFTIMIPHSKAMSDALLEQHATSSDYAGYGFQGTWPQQHMPEAVKPVETICLKDGSIADIVVVGEMLFTLRHLCCSCGCQ